MAVSVIRIVMLVLFIIQASLKISHFHVVIVTNVTIVIIIAIITYGTFTGWCTERRSTGRKAKQRSKQNWQTLLRWTHMCIYDYNDANN